MSRQALSCSSSLLFHIETDENDVFIAHSNDHQMVISRSSSSWNTPVTIALVVFALAVVAAVLFFLIICHPLRCGPLVDCLTVGKWRKGPRM